MNTNFFQNEKRWTYSFERFKIEWNVHLQFMIVYIAYIECDEVDILGDLMKGCLFNNPS